MDPAAGAIPREEALKICETIRSQYRGKFWTLPGLQCWGCTTFTRNDPNKRCFSSRPDFRGCQLVNARYDLARPEG